MKERLCFKTVSIHVIFISHILLALPDSDATTVPAPTPEARRIAQEGFEQAKKVDKSQDEPRNADTKQPTMPRRLQSEQVLDQQKPVETTLPSSQNVKKSESSASLGNTKDKVLAEAVKVEVQKATAVKAKALPPKQENTPAENTPAEKAVHECLQRSSTSELEQLAQKAKEPQAKEPSKATERQTSQPTPTPTEPAPKPRSDVDKGDKESQENKDGDKNQEDEESSSGEDSEDLRAKEEQLQAKKEARARYMRFHRSLSSILVILYENTGNLTPIAKKRKQADTTRIDECREMSVGI